MGLALLLIIFRGSASEGQQSIFGNLLSSYIEETAASAATDLSQNQLADINSISAISGLGKSPRPSSLNTIQDNSIVSRGSILTTILDDFSDRGNQIAAYTVQDGDTLSFIASDYGVSVKTIIWANKLKDADDIKPGM